MKELGTKMNGKESTSKKLRIVIEQWLDKLHYKKVKLKKCIEIRNWKKHNMMFQRWMEEVKTELVKRENLVSEIAIPDENMKKEFAKPKNWTEPGIYDIQNFWWKKFKQVQKALRKAFTDLYMDTVIISEW